MPENVVMQMSPPSQITRASTRAWEMLDVTDDVAALVDEAALSDGVVHLFCPHTSCGLAVTELEDGLHHDFEALLDRIAPVDARYVHDDLAGRTQNLEPDERRNGWSHMRGLIATTPSLTLPIRGGALAVGRWQRVFLVELDGPRLERTVHVQAWGRPRAQTPRKV